jgi:catecholate siderophore receptor
MNTAGNQNRSRFVKGGGAIAVTDPDEWDDLTHNSGSFKSILTSPQVNIASDLPGTVVLTGSQRSEGVELGIQGKVQEGWNLIGALAIQNAEITSATSSAPVGRKAPLAAEFSASFWNRVSLTEQFDVALGVVHQGEQFASISNAVVLPSYTRLDAALFYAVNDAVDLQMNLENLTGEEYWYTAHNDNNITPGAPLGVRVGLTLRH